MTETTTSTTRLKALEGRSATAFLIAGVLSLAFAILNRIEAFTDVATGQIPGYVVAYMATGVFGLIVAIIGLLGLYPRTSRRTPRLSLGGVAAFGMAILGLLGVVGWFFAAGAPENVPIAVTLVAVASVLLITLGFGLFAVAILRTSTPSRTVGYLLMVPVVTWTWHYVSLAMFGSTWIGTFVDYTVIGVAFLAVGYQLRSEAETIDRTEPSATEVQHD